MSPEVEFLPSIVTVLALVLFAPATPRAESMLPEIPNCRLKTVGKISALAERVTFELGTHEFSAETWRLDRGCITRAEIGGSTLVIATDFEAGSERHWLKGSSPLAYYPEGAGGIQTADLHAIGMLEVAGRRRFIEGGDLLGDYEKIDSGDGSTVHESLLEVGDVRPPVQSLAKAVVRNGRVVEYSIHLGSDSDGWTPRYLWQGTGSAPGVEGLPAKIRTVSYVAGENPTEVRENTVFELAILEVERLGSRIDFEAKMRELTGDLEPVAPGMSPDRLRRLPVGQGVHYLASTAQSGSESAGWLRRNRPFIAILAVLCSLAALAAWLASRGARGAPAGKTGRQKPR